MADLEIVIGERDELPEYGKRVSHGGPKTLAGYNEVFKHKGAWWPLHEELDTGARTLGPSQATYEAAKAELERWYDQRKAFWDEKTVWVMRGDKTEDGEQCLRVGHHHFVVGADIKKGAPDSWQGMGGRPFRFKLADGTELITRNLWAQGAIPSDYWSILPDNAEDTTPENPYSLIEK